ncbi:MAG: AAA family ATPase [Clostridia bacterium]|nr:AAA family ATPase [Clostridia bacterium]
MIIKNLYLKSYGKFENYTMQFSDGINIIYGKNESGKSTIASALKALLYPTAKKEYAYKRSYIPFSEKQGYLEMEFEQSGENYETTLLLGETNAKTVCKTYLKPLNREINMGNDSIGEHFLNLREDMFDSVCFVQNLNLMDKISETNREICELLSENSVPDAGITKVTEELDADIRRYLRKTDSGLIYPYALKLSEMEERIENCLKRRKEAENISKEITELGNKNSLQNKNKKTEKINKAAGLIFFICFIICMVLGFFNKIFFPVGALSLLSAYFLTKESKADEDTETKIEIATLTERYKNLTENTEDYNTLLNLKKELQDKISEAKNRLNVLKTTKEILNIAIERRKEDYIPALNRETEEILSGILDIEKLRVNDRMELSYTEKGKFFEKNSSSFSKGTKDVVYFALRLAVHKLTNASSPLILDDCFAETDDERFEKCINFLLKKHKGQVFYFTCHKRIFQNSLAKDHINEL